MVQASALVSPLCPNISTPLLCPPGDAEIYHEPVVRGRQAAMLLSQQHGKELAGFCALSMKPACSWQAYLLSTYCAQSSTTSHPQRCRPALTSSPILGRNTDGCILLYPRFRETGESLLPLSALLLQPHFRCGRPQRCLSVKGKFSLCVPVWGGGGGAKKPDRSQEALRERGAYYKSRQNQQERACWARRCPLTPRPCPQGGGDTVPLSPVFSHLLSSVISSKLAIVE